MLIKKLSHSFLLLYFTTNTLKAHTFQDPLKWKNQEVMEALRDGKIKKIEPIQNYLKKNGKCQEFGGDVFLVSLENGMQAVFKPSKDGPEDEDHRAARIEVAAYNASTVLGFPYVPPTVLRVINNKTGSLQLFVPTKMDLLVPGVYEKFVADLDPMERIRLYLFYFIFGQFDNGPHNLLALKRKGKYYPIAIDNEGMANLQHVEKLGALPFVAVAYSEKFNCNDWDKPFPFHAVQSIMQPNEANLKATFLDKLPLAFYKNYKSYGLPLYYVIYQNRLWRQFHAGNKGYISLFINRCDPQTLASIKKIDLSILRSIFNVPNNQNEGFYNQYFAGILHRRDQLLAFFQKKA